MTPFLRYARAKYEHENETKSYRVYVTESLRLRGESKYLTIPWLEAITPQEPPPKEDERPCKEIAADIWKRIRGE